MLRYHLAHRLSHAPAFIDAGELICGDRDNAGGAITVHMPHRDQRAVFDGDVAVVMSERTETRVAHGIGDLIGKLRIAVIGVAQIRDEMG